MRRVRSTFLPRLTAVWPAVFPGRGDFSHPAARSSAPSSPPSSPPSSRPSRGHPHVVVATHTAQGDGRYHNVWVADSLFIHRFAVDTPGSAAPAETDAVHPLLLAAAERQFGLFTAADARRAGYDHDEIRQLRSSGAWVRLRRGVYVPAERLAQATARGQRHRIDALGVLLSLNRPSATLSHGTAARLWGLPVRRDLPRTTRVTDPARWRQGRDFRVVGAPLPRGDVVVDGPLRLTSVARTLIDCGREWRLEDTVVAMDFALLVERTSVVDLQRAAAAAQYWPGTPAAMRALRLTDGRAESPLETRGRLRMLGAGLPAPQLQVEIHASRDLVGVVDAWFDDAAVAVEFDGQIKYTDPWRARSPGRVLWDEKRREDELRALDIRVVRIAEEDLRRRWGRTEARLRELLSQPGPAVRRFTAVPRSRGVRRSAS